MEKLITVSNCHMLRIYINLPDDITYTFNKNIFEKNQLI